MYMHVLLYLCAWMHIWMWEYVCAHAHTSICVFVCMRALAFVHVGVWVSVCVCVYVHVAPRTCPLAMASLNISLTSNIICTVRLNKPTHTYSLRQRPTHIHKQHQEKPRWHVHNGMTKLELCPVNYSITHIRTKTQTHIYRVIWIPKQHGGKRGEERMPPHTHTLNSNWQSSSNFYLYSCYSLLHSGLTLWK